MSLVLNITNGSGAAERLSLKLNGTYPIPEGSAIDVESISGLIDIQWQDGRLTLTFTDGVVVLEGISAEQLQALAPAFGDIRTSALGNDGETNGVGLDLARLFSGNSQNGNRSSVDSFEASIETGLGGTGDGQNQRTNTPTPLQQNDAQTTNSSPLAAAISGLATENGSAISMSANFTDADGNDTHTFSIDVTGTAGQVTDNGDGTFSYATNGAFESLGAGQTATDSFTYTVTDATGASSTATATVTIQGTNDAPVGSNGSASGDEDTTITGTVIASDVDGDSLTYALATGGDPAHGSVSFNGSQYTYVPEADFNGSDSFDVEISDGNGGADIVTISVTVNPVNDAPSGTYDAVTGDEDTAITGTIVATDVEGDSLTYALATGGAPAHGSVAFIGSQYIYTPDADFNGSDRFNVEISDGNGGTDTVTIDITVTPVNDAPAGANGSSSGDEDTAITGTVTATDVDGDGLTYALATGGGPTHGSVSFNGSQYAYTPDADFNGSDSFDVEISDGNGGTDTVTIDITVTPVNDAPVAAADSYSVDEDGILSVDAAQGLLANDGDVDSAAFSAVLVGDVANGTLTLNADGSFIYRPDADFSGTDNFTYKVSDGTADGNTVTVTLNVGAIDDAPVAVTDGFTVSEDSGATVFDVLANDTDLDGGPIAIQSVTQPTGGTVAIVNSGANVSFTPDANFNGSTSFTYTLNGGSTATVSVIVTPVNDAPVLSATGSPPAVDEVGDASAQDIDALTGNLTVSDADAGDTLTASIDGAPTLAWSGGTLSAAQEATLLAALGTGKLSFDGSVSADGSAQSLGWSWDPAAADLDFLANGQTLTVTYDVAVGDGTLTTATQPLSFTIAGTNDAPVAYMDTGTLTEDDGPTTFDVLANDTLDPDAGALNTVTVGNITLGTNSYGLTASDVQVTVTADNQLTVELLGSGWDALPNGITIPLTVQYRLNGDDGEFAGNQLRLTVQGRNDAPVLDAGVDLSISVSEDAGLPGAGEGTLVSDLVDRVGGGGLDNVTDDSFITGIAITGTNTDHGTWYYSTNDGASWTEIASVSDAHALTLRPDARVAFVPEDGYNGTVSDGLTIRAWDGSGGANGSYWDTTSNGGTTGYSAQTDTVAVTVDAVNDAPVLSATGSPSAVNEAGDASAQDIDALTGNLTVSDADAGDTLTASIDGAPTLAWSGGTLSAAQEATLLAALGTGKLSFDGSVTADGSAQSLGWSWDPAAADLDFLASGETLTITYDVAVGDGTLTTATQPLSFTIAGTNDAPVAYMDTGTLTEDDGPTTFDVLANDTLDPDAGALNTVTVGNITLGTNSYGLTASDVQVTVTADNQLTVELLGSGWDGLPNGVTLPLTIQYRLNGDNGEFAGNQLSLTVYGRNDAPVLDASADLAISISEDAGLPAAGQGTLVSDLVDRVGGGGLDNVTDDSFITGIAITGTNTAHGTWYYSTSDGAHWTEIASVSDAHALTLRPDARVAFVPEDGYNGTVSDGLTIRAWDGSGGANGSYWDTTNNGGTTGYSAQTDTVALTVDAVNDAPVASNDAFSGSEDTQITGNVLADNGAGADSDVDGDALTVTAGTFATAQGGSVTIDANGAFTYTPAADFNGADSFTYTVSDGTAADTGTVTLSVGATDDAPVAVADGFTVGEDSGATVFDVLANDTDTDGGLIAIQSVTQPTGGTVAIVNGGANVSFTPDADFNGTTSFTYTLNGGSTETVTVTVTPVNDAPVAADDALSGITDFVVNEYTNGNQLWPSIATLTNGNIVVTWDSDDQGQGDASYQGVKASIFDANGNLVVPEFQVNEFTYSSQVESAVTALADGRFVVTWVSYDGQQGDPNTAIKARIFDAGGNEVVSEFVVNAFTNDRQYNPEITALSSGGFVVTWESRDGQQGDADQNGIKARVFDASGNELVSEFLVNEFPQGNQYDPTITALSGGGFMVLWYSPDGQQGDTDGAIKARIFDAAGTEVVSEFLVNEFTNGGQYRPTAVELPGGNIVVSWVSQDGQQGDPNSAIKAKIIDGNGNDVVSEFLVNEFTNGTQYEPQMVVLDNGNFVVVWRSGDGQQGDASQNGIKARIFDAAGNEVVSEFLVNEFTDGNQAAPVITALESGGFVVSWYSLGGEQEDSDAGSIKARIFDANGVPVATPLTDQETAFTFTASDLLANDTDADGDTLVISSIDGTSANGATITQNGGSYSYNPNGAFDHLAEGETATDTFTYTVTDGNGGFDTATVSVIVTGKNDAAVVAGDTTGTVTEDGTLTASGTLAVTDVDTGQGAVVAQTDTAGTYGSFSIDANGNWSYALNTAAAAVQQLGGGDHVTDSFTVTTDDGTTATVTVTVNGTNDAPVAANDAFSGSEDMPITGNVLADNGTGADSDVDGDTLTVTAGTFATAQGGSVTIDANGAFTFTPAANFNGSDSFTYTVSDGTTTDTGTVSLSIGATDDAPVAVADSFTVGEDSGATVLDVLANDTDTDGGLIAIQSVTQPAGGTVAIVNGGTNVSFTPNADFNGSTSFTYTLNGGSTGTVSVTVTPVNDAPMVSAIDAGSVSEDGSLQTINLLAGQTDVDGDTLSAANIIVTDNLGASVAFTNNGDGTISIDPDQFGAVLNSGDSRTVTVSYDVSDGTATTANTATLVVTGADEPNTAPVANDDTLSGIAQTGEFLVNSETNSHQIIPDVALLQNGGFVITWSSFDGTDDASNSGVKAQVFAADGTAVGEEFLVNTVTNAFQSFSKIAALPDGNFVITWSTTDGIDDPSGYGVKAQIFSADGTAVGGEFLVNTTTNLDQASSGIAALANGGFVITWQSNDGAVDTDNGIKAQIFAADGTTVGNEFLVNSNTAELQADPGITALSNGNFVITWQSFDGADDTSGSGIKAQIFAADGTTVGDEFLVNSVTNSLQERPDITALPNGGFVIAWMSLDGMDDASLTGIKAQIFAADGTTVGDEFLVNSETSGDQSVPEIAALPNGGFVITWYSNDGADDASLFGVKAQIFAADGTAIGGELLVNSETNDTQSQPAVAALSNGGFIITWQSNDQIDDTSGTSIKAQIFDAHGNPVGSGFGEDTVHTIDVATLLSNDTDTDGDALTVTSVSTTSANGATVTLNGDGTISYDPTGSAAIQALGAGETLQDTFSYTISDGQGGTDTATVTLTVSGLSHAPVVSAIDAGSVSEDDAVRTINLLTGQTDVDGDTLSAANITVTDNLGGTVAFTDNGDGTISIDPDQFGAALNSGDSRTVTVSYDVSDGTATTANTATLVVTGADDNTTPLAQANDVSINPILEGWTALADNGHIYKFVSGDTSWTNAESAAAGQISGSSYLATVTSTAEDGLIDTLVGSGRRTYLGATDTATESTWQWVTGPEAGTTFWVGNSAGSGVGGAFTDWAPGQPSVTDATGDEDYLATDLSHRWNDVVNSNYQLDIGYTAEAGGLNGDTYAAITEAAPFTFSESWLLANDANAPDHILSVSATSSMGASVAYNAATGEITYDASGSAALQALNTGDTGADTFTYTIDDGNGGTSTATVTVTVTGVTDAPAAMSAMSAFAAPAPDYIGTAGDDTIAFTGGAFGVIDGDAGTDTLSLSGQDIVLDFTQLGQDRVTSIEAIDLTGTGDNSVVIALEDVLDTSHDVSGNTTTLTINGDAGDSVTLSGSGWTQGADTQINGETYHVYTNDTGTEVAKLVVQDHATVNAAA